MTQLSQASARQILPGEEIRCHVVKGLSLRCKPTGAAWFLLYTSPVDGKRRRPKIGDFPALTVENARSAARIYLQRVASGEDPSADKQERRHAPTVADLHEWYMDNHARPHKAVKSIRDDERNFKSHLAADLGDLRVADLTAADINRTLAKIADATTGTTANRCRSLLCTMLNLAEADALGWRPKRSNPISGRDVPRRPEFARRRKVEPAEWPKLRDAMADAAKRWPRHVTAIVCILYAGSRVTELCTANWGHVEGGAIVRADHKSARTGRYRTIQLPEQAWSLIAKLPRFADGRIFGPDMSANSLDEVWGEIRQHAGCPDLQLRDLRRTFASLLRSTGGTLADVGGILGHSNPAVTDRHYAHLFEDVAAKKVQGAADHADGLLSGLALPVAALEHKGR